ncbi:GRAS family transcription factor, partial [Trifolium medium]|nr:GRAS family transcription factor [Trifolium medium]
NRRGGDDELRLERFMNNKLPIFDGGYDPEGAQKWLESVERIFKAMRCQDEHKVTLGSYVFHEEADYWWGNASQRLGAVGTLITWDMFKREFLVKYFPADVRNRKVIEFMELKQGNLSVANYAAKFESLCRFSPHYNTVEAEYDKCVKFESGLRPDIKQLIGFSE